MDTGYLKLFELVMLFGGLLAFGVWQLRSVERARRRRLEAEAAAAAAAAADGCAGRTADPAGDPAVDLSAAPRGEPRGRSPAAGAGRAGSDTRA